MRCIIRKLTLLAAALMLFAVPVLADEGAMDKALEQGQQELKNECLLVAMNCPNQVDTIQQRIERIKGEIARGSYVYTNDELGILNRQLEEAEKNLQELGAGG
jgi:hypothetical protein